jgi:hypothetical protein
VCVAGYTADGRCIRPVLPHPGVQECSLYAGGSPIIFPFAIVEYEFIEPVPDPPHTEDYLFDPGRVRGCGVLPPDKRQEFLCRTLSPSVADIFGATVYKDIGYFVYEGSGTHSLGTIRVGAPITVSFGAEGPHSLKPRIAFCDESGVQYTLAVSDLAWRYYAEHLYGDKHFGFDALALHCESLLRSEVFLRIGLARGWSKHPDRCYLQITGVQTFPDYLHGRTFADFAPQTDDDDW